MRIRVTKLRFFTVPWESLGERHDEHLHRAMRNRRSVALLIETSNAYARGLLAAITAYVVRPEVDGPHTSSRPRRFRIDRVEQLLAGRTTRWSESRLWRDLTIPST